MNDLTVIMLTANKVPEGWAKYHRQALTDAIGDTPIITISAKPLDWGLNLIQTDYSIPNLYRQILRGATTAETPYIAIAEDDTLYPPCHFTFRPEPKCFAYNHHRWQIMTWKKRAAYFLRDACANGTMIAPRQLVIDALSRRFEHSPDLIGWMSKELGDKHSVGIDGGTAQRFHSAEGVVAFCHDYSIDVLNQTHRKAQRPIQAFVIPLWGDAQDVRAKFV